MSSATDLFDGFPRGVFESEGVSRSLEDQAMPRAGFLRTSSLRKSRLLTHDPAKLFLGVIDGTAQTTSETGRSSVQGGQPIGFGDDTHAFMAAGKRS